MSNNEFKTPWWRQLWIWIKGILGIQSTDDLLRMAISRTLTPELFDLIVALIQEAAMMSVSGPDKKVRVMKRLAEVQGELRKNIDLLGKDALSRMVNLTVELMQLNGTALNHETKYPAL